ncbi:hypothetical protein H9P43_009357 [Blastocladiella emersonii ATCC 22665]|nr:hypothetical protein H9P43_009357 [Blastocladiella emersonii ATCC 22665]
MKQTTKTLTHVARHAAGDAAFRVPDADYHRVDVIRAAPLEVSPKLPYLKVYTPLALLLETGVLKALHTHAKPASVQSLHTDPEHAATVQVRGGALLLALTKDVYQTLGLAGSKVGGSKGGRGDDRYLVRVPLEPKSQKLVQRAHWCFTHTLTSAFDLAVRGPPALLDAVRAAASALGAPVTECAARVESWSPPNGAVWPAIGPVADLLAAPAPDKKRVKGQQPKTGPAKSRTTLPLETREAVSDLLEWAGLVAARGDRLAGSEGVDPFVSTYRAPGTDEDAEPRPVAVTTVRGFLGASDVQAAVLDAVRPVPVAAAGQKRAHNGDDEPAAAAAVTVDEDTYVVAYPVPNQIHGLPAQPVVPKAVVWMIPAKPRTGFVVARIEAP